ncbi:TPA: hypothetical protein ACH3X1_001172 [Trebouxia sp. C0004]
MVSSGQKPSTRGCCGSPDDSIDYVLDAPPHQAASEPDATDNLALPSVDEDSESGCVTPPADSSEEQDLCKHMLDYITDTVQQIDTDRESARPEPNQEAEIMAFLMKRLSECAVWLALGQCFCFHARGCTS